MRFLQVVAPLALIVSVLGANAVQAAVVNETLPTPDDNHGWRTAAFSLAHYDYDANELSLETNTGGVFFGTELGGGAPGISLGSSSDGNEVRLTARFADGSRDWSTYLADGNYFAGMLFGPTGCDGDAQDCYYAPYTEGVLLSFATGLNSGVVHDRFIDLDMQIDHDFGFLMKDGLISYFIDGQTYSGYAQNAQYRILVIGDGSGSTRTGSGIMTLSGVSIDNAPEADVVLSVPEPASWGMMLAGFGLVGGALRGNRRRAVNA